jgi:hypothetical protein
MKKFLSSILFVFAAVLLMAGTASANTWSAPVEQYPHGGPSALQHTQDFISPANPTTAAAKANPYGYFNTIAATTTECTAGTFWTFYTYDLVPPRAGSNVWTGYVHYWKQSC